MHSNLTYLFQEKLETKLNNQLRSNMKETNVLNHRNNKTHFRDTVIETHQNVVENKRFFTGRA